MSYLVAPVSHSAQPSYQFGHRESRNQGSHCARVWSKRTCSVRKDEPENEGRAQKHVSRTDFPRNVLLVGCPANKGAISAPGTHRKMKRLSRKLTLALVVLCWTAALLYLILLSWQQVSDLGTKDAQYRQVSSTIIPYPVSSHLSYIPHAGKITSYAFSNSAG